MNIANMLIGGWHPQQTLPLYLDWDADKIAGNDGDALATWSNVGPAGTADWSQGTAANKPTLKTGSNGINNHRIVRFDGTNDLMTGTYSRPEGAHTFFMVHTYKGTQPFAGSGALVQVAELVGSASADALILIDSAGYQPYSYKAKCTAAGAMVGIADVPDGNPHVIGWTYNNGTSASTSSYTCWLDGVAKTVAASGNATRSAANTPAIGAFATGPLFHAQVDIARYLWFTGVLSAANMAAVSKYLMNIYGL